MFLLSVFSTVRNDKFNGFPSQIGKLQSIHCLYCYVTLEIGFNTNIRNEIYLKQLETIAVLKRGHLKSSYGIKWALKRVRFRKLN